MITQTVTNTQFAREVGVHFTTASRYRNGERVPSVPTALKIAEVYHLDAGEMMTAMAEGGDAFGHYIRMHVFGPEPAVDLIPIPPGRPA